LRTTALTIEDRNRAKNSNIEACFFQIQVDTDQYQNGGLIQVNLEKSTTAQMFVYKGPLRTNVTQAIEGDSLLVVGSPVSIPISDGAVVVLQIADLESAGEITFSYRVDALEYSWYQSYFVGSDPEYYLAFQIIFGFLLFMVVCFPPCGFCMLICSICFYVEFKNASEYIKKYAMGFDGI
jgi:hypothetical protein